MCFPIKFLQLIHVIVVTSLIIFGVILEIISLVLFFKYHEFMYSKSLYIGIPFVGAFSIIISLLGLYGFKKQNRCFVAVFHCFTIILTLILILITMILFLYGLVYSSQELLEILQPACINYEKDEINLNQIALSAEEQFCQQGCTCYISNPSAWQPGVLDAYKYSTDDQNPYIQFQECPDYEYQNESTQVQYLAQLEEDFECAGWCKNSSIYLFSNVNRGPPITGPCYRIYINQIGAKILSISYLFIAITFFVILEVVMICCFQFHPERNPRYQRLYNYINYFQIE